MSSLYSINSQYDLSYADFSHVEEDEEMSVSSLLTYSSMLTKYTREIFLESKNGTKSDALSGKIILIQTTKDNTRLKYRIKAINITETKQEKATVDRLEQLRKKKRRLEAQYISIKLSRSIKNLDEKILHSKLCYADIEI